MKKILFLFLLGIFAVELQAQDEKSKIEERPSGINLEALPYYNFGKGVGITSPDSLFQFNIRFRMQNRLQIEENDEGETEYQAKIRRLRLRFDGYVGSPEFMYVIQLSFSPDDVGEITEGESLKIIRDAVVFYRPDKHWTFAFGQTKLPGNRQRVNSSGALQLTDRSINNAAYNIDRDFGLQATYGNARSEGFGYNIKGAVSTGEGRNFTGKSTGLAYTGRAEIYPTGKFKGGGEFFEGDLKREQKPKYYLGATFHRNENAKYSQGQRGKTLYQDRLMHSFLADAVMKYNGWAVMGSYMQRTSPDPIAINLTNPAETNYVQVGKGYDLQASYTFPNFWEIIGRYSNNKPDSSIQNLLPEQNQWVLGMTKYLWEHAFKAQLEFTKTYNHYFDGQKSDDWYVRFQIEIGI